jgi:hypothetical protein
MEITTNVNDKSRYITQSDYVSTLRGHSGFGRRRTSREGERAKSSRLSAVVTHATRSGMDKDSPAPTNGHVV